MSTLREEVRAAVKQIIALVKQIDEGVEDIPDNAPLFDDGLGEPSRLALDSLDALDLALALKERFDPEGQQFEALLNGDIDLQALGTVNQIVEFILSVSPPMTGGRPATVRQGAGADE